MELNDRIILFDGFCNLCNGFVNFVINRDRKSRFKFGALQSKTSDMLLNVFDKNNGKIYSVMYIENGKLYSESTAVLRICRKLNGIWPLAYIFIIIPKFFRDWIYRFVAKNRYKWFGKRDVCRVPEPGIEERFI